MEDNKNLQEEQAEFVEIDPDELNRIAGGSTYTPDGEWVINNDN